MEEEEVFFMEHMVGVLKHLKRELISKFRIAGASLRLNNSDIPWALPELRITESPAGKNQPSSHVSVANLDDV